MSVRFIRHHMLRSKFMLIALTILLTVFILLFVNLIKIKDSQLQSILEQESTRVENILSKRFDATALVIEKMGEDILKKPQNQHHIKNILEQYRQDRSLNQIFSWTVFSWANQDSQIIVDGKYGIMTEPYDLSQRDYIPDAIAHPGKLVLGKPVYGSTSHKWMIPGGIAMVDAKGQLMGMLAVGFEIRNVTSMIQNELVDGSVRVDLVYRHKKPVFSVSKAMIHIFEQDKSIDSLISDHVAATLKKPLSYYPYDLVLTYDQKGATRLFWDLVHLRFLEISAIFLLMLVLIITFIKSETARRNKIALLTKVSQSKNQFTLEVSHELDNFVSAMIGLTSLAKDHIKDEEAALSHLEHIHDIGQELMAFSNDLVDLNQPEDGGFNICPVAQNVDFEDLIYRTIRLLKSKIKDKNIMVNTKCDDVLPVVSNLDQRRLKQVFVSIIGNAIKFSEDSAKIDLMVKAAGSNVEITITDYGCGMDSAKIKKSLRDYDKADYELYNEDCSMELKLPIVRFLVEKQGGSIVIHSSKAKGTKVVLSF